MKEVNQSTPTVVTESVAPAVAASFPAPPTLTRRESLQADADTKMDEVLEMFNAEGSGWDIKPDALDKDTYKLVMKASKLLFPEQENDLYHFITRRVKKALK